MQNAKSFANFIKIEHSLFSLPLIYSGVFLASREFPSVSLLVLILIGGIAARTAALALNRIIDRHIDAKNPRTVVRELPSGRMTLRSAFVVLVLGLIVYIWSAASISMFCLLLSPLPLLVFTVYPYMKRFTHFAHFGVGLGLAMAPMGGWFAVQNSFDGILPGLLLSLFTLFWVAGFDIIYSTLDELFDKEAGLHSFSSRFGRESALQFSAYLHILSFLTLGTLFVLYIRALAALPFLIITGILLYLEQKKSNDVELAFFKINAVLGFAVFAMVIAGVYFQ